MYLNCSQTKLNVSRQIASYKVLHSFSLNPSNSSKKTYCSSKKKLIVHRQSDWTTVAPSQTDHPLQLRWQPFPLLSFVGHQSATVLMRVSQKLRKREREREREREKRKYCKYHFLSDPCHQVKRSIKFDVHEGQRQSVDDQSEINDITLYFLLTFLFSFLQLTLFSQNNIYKSFDVGCTNRVKFFAHGPPCGSLRVAIIITITIVN